MHEPTSHDTVRESRIAEALAAADGMIRARQYWEAHETLEHVWLGCAGTDRNLLAGAILCAAALHKARKQDNPVAARRIYARALYRLATVPDACRGIDVRALERETLAAIHDHECETRLPPA